MSLDNFVIVIGGRNSVDPFERLSTRVIRIYNLYTEEWGNHVMPATSDAPEPFTGAVAVAIDKTIYIFGGYSGKNWDAKETNALWKLSRTIKGGFSWSVINPQCKEKSPSPRHGHTGWEYAGKLWIFAGMGHSLEGYLHDHGDNEGDTNNQLLCFDPSIEKWSNPQCFGSVPAPRCGHASAIIKDMVWVFGGCTYHGDKVGHHIFELRMNSLTWNVIQTAEPHPQGRTSFTLTVTDDNLVLHGGCGKGELWPLTALSDTWIMDLASHSWTPYTSRKDHTRASHTGCTGLNNNVIIIGGNPTCDERDDPPEVYDNIFQVMLEPKSLQQVAMQAILKHQSELPLNCLPVKLLSLMGIPGKQNQKLLSPLFSRNSMPNAMFYSLLCFILFILFTFIVLFHAKAFCYVVEQ